MKQQTYLSYRTENLLQSHCKPLTTFFLSEDNKKHIFFFWSESFNHFFCLD